MAVSIEPQQLAHVIAASQQPNLRWQAIPSLPRYEVSETGGVRVAGQLTTFRRPHVHRQYLCCGFTCEGVHHKRSIHSIVVEAFIGPSPSPGNQIRHLNGNPLDNQWKVNEINTITFKEVDFIHFFVDLHYSNLAWGSPKQNSADSKKHGTWAHGERFPYAKLTREEVLTIRAARKSGMSSARVAALLGGKVSAGHIKDLTCRNPTAWNWLP